LGQSGFFCAALVFFVPLCPTLCSFVLFCAGLGKKVCNPRMTHLLIPYYIFKWNTVTIKPLLQQVKHPTHFPRKLQKVQKVARKVATRKATPKVARSCKIAKATRCTKSSKSRPKDAKVTRSCTKSSKSRPKDAKVTRSCKIAARRRQAYRSEDPPQGGKSLTELAPFVLEQSPALPLTFGRFHSKKGGKCLFWPECELAKSLPPSICTHLRFLL
jgi:hypothetical protein